MKIKQLLQHGLNFFFFTDVTKLMKSLQKRQANADDLNQIDCINSALRKPDPYPSFDIIQKSFRTSPLLNIIKLEKKSFLYMFFLHTTDILSSLLAIYFAMQILATFENSTLSRFKLIELFFQNPNSSSKFIFAIILAFAVFFLNMMAATIHAHKLEREMFLEWRIPTKITQTVYHFLLNISSKSREKYQSGDITNIVQNDARFITSFFAHAFIDFAVILIACILIVCFMIFSIGSAAWFGVIVIILQIPLSLFFAWIGVKFHEKLMQYSDQRIHSITEFIQGMRLLRYLNWGSYFVNEIKTVTNKEFFQDIKLSLQFCLSFSVISNLWMFISAAIFAGYLMIYHGVRDASVLFGVMWLAKLFGQQISPLPWFLHTFVQSIVASKRMKKFFLSKTQDEEFAAIHSSEMKIKQGANERQTQDNQIIEKITEKKYEGDFSISFEFDRVYFKYIDEGPYILKDISFSIKENQTLAIVGSVGAGKSTLLKILIGEYIPTSGKVYICVHIPIGNKPNHIIKINLHTRTGINLLRSIQTLVPQEPFIVTSTIRENVSFEYNHLSNSNENDDRVMNSILKASLLYDLSQFSDHLDTEIGERGVNLSGGQKQRLSLARKFYKNSKVVFMDDPFSAVDTKTEKEMIENIFFLENISGGYKSQKTIVWTTHRLQHLNVSDRIMLLENGVLVEK